MEFRCIEPRNAVESMQCQRESELLKNTEKNRQRNYDENEIKSTKCDRIGMIITS